MHNLYGNTRHNMNRFICWIAVVSISIIILFLINFYLYTRNKYCEDYDVICVDVSTSNLKDIVTYDDYICRMMMNSETDNGI